MKGDDRTPGPGPEGDYKEALRALRFSLRPLREMFHATGATFYVTVISAEVGHEVKLSALSRC
jgi:hypothetical protein